jgi:hypothetical protein
MNEDKTTRRRPAAAVLGLLTTGAWTGATWFTHGFAAALAVAGVCGVVALGVLGVRAIWQGDGM